ncbi:MAG: hypothetical protein WCA06_05465, partial [Terrimicrobiaceae bacterium]
MAIFSLLGHVLRPPEAGSIAQMASVKVLLMRDGPATKISTCLPIEMGCCGSSVVTRFLTSTKTIGLLNADRADLYQFSIDSSDITVTKRASKRFYRNGDGPRFRYGS